MLSRRKWLVVVSAAACACLFGPAAGAAEKPKLRDRLRKLNARTKAERAFVAHVVQLVDQGDLSEKLVDRVFFWALKKAARKFGAKQKRPMVYFRPALIRLAKKFENVDL